MPKPRLIVLAVDGLRASPLGAYGGGAATPSIDRLASEATVCDWFFADAPELENACGALWRDARAWLGRGAALVTDDDRLTPLADAAGFASVEQLAPPTAPEPAVDLAETWLAATFGAFADAVAEPERADADAALWLHTRGLFGPWDAPAAMVEALLDEDDPPVGASTTPASGAISPDAPDASFAALCRYTAQVQVLDACLGGFVDYLDDLYAGDPFVFAVLGVRGYALGEHGVIGEDDRLYAESLHSPLIVRHGDGQDALRRVGAPLGSSGVGQALRHDWSGSGPDTVRQSSASGACAVQRGEWRLIQPAGASGGDGDRGSPELFLKPDDRWEANNVASLMPMVVEELLTLLAPTADMAGRGDSN